MKLITISRNKARLLRSIFRRAVLGIRHKGTIPPLVLHAEGAHLRARFQFGGLAVEYVDPGNYSPLDSIPVPLDVLAEVEGPDNTPVIFEAAGPDRTIVRWQDRGIPQVQELPVTPFGNVEPFPDSPTTWAEASGNLLSALAEATRICTENVTRYALNCIQLRGSEHKILATDGHQLLIRSGFAFPWDADLLIRSSPIFASKSFGSDRPIQIGKTASHVVLRIGLWTTYHEIQKNVRFPEVEEAIPVAEAVATRILIDPDDAHFLETALERLPGNEELNRSGHDRHERQGRDQSPRCRTVTHHRAGPEPIELHRSSDPHQQQPRIPGPGDSLRLQRDRHHRCRGSDRLSRSSSNLRLAAAER